MMTRVAVVAGVLVVLGASGYFYVVNQRVNDQARTVQLVAAQQGKFTAYVTGRGKLVARKSEQLTSLIGGIVSDKGATVGQVIRKGMSIAGLRLAEYELRKKQQELDFALIDFDLLDAQLQQSEELLKAKASSEREVKEAKIRKYKQEKLVRSLREEVGERLIRAGFDGLLVEKLFHSNDRVSAGAPLATIIDTSSYAVEISVPQRHMRGLHSGQAIQYVSETFGGIRLGKIQEISRASVAKQQGQYGGADTEPEFIVRGSFEISPLDRVLIGSQIEARFILEEKENALFVPIEAIVYQNDSSMIFLAVQGTARRRFVKLGLVNERLVEIERGISPGDTVITIGNLDVDEGAAIKTAEKLATDDQAKPRNRPNFPSR